MDNLTPDVVAQICALTDDNTIFNLACSCKTFNKLLQSSRGQTLFYRNTHPNYELNSLKDISNEFKYIPYK